MAHTHADGAPYSTIAMCPPHLVLKWAREVLMTAPGARAFIIYDLRKGGDPTRPHGVVEVHLRKGQPVSKGLKTSLFEMRAMGRKRWRKLCPGPAYFIVSRETGKLSYDWKHTYSVAECGPDKGAVVSPDTGTTIPSQDGGFLTRLDFAALKHSETVSRSNDGTVAFSALWQADRDKIQRMAPHQYIGRFMKGWWDYAIADELHHLVQETAPGQQPGRALSPGTKGYLTVGLYPNGQPGEIFVRMAKKGSTIPGLMECFGTVVSVSLQHGVPLKVLCDKLSHTRFEPSGWTGNEELGYAKSIMDYLFRWMESRFLSGKHVALFTQQTAVVVRQGSVEANQVPASISPFLHDSDEIGDAPLCDTCGSLMVRNGSCDKCTNCGGTSGCS